MRLPVPDDSASCFGRRGVMGVALNNSPTHKSKSNTGQLGEALSGRALVGRLYGAGSVKSRCIGTCSCGWGCC